MSQSLTDKVIVVTGAAGGFGRLISVKAAGLGGRLVCGDIDTAGLQLLILLKKEAQRAGKRVAIVAHSQAVRSVIDFCNLAAELGDPLVIPAAESV